MKSSLVIVALAACLLAVQASCPNMCSGHGTCGANDLCTCYRQTGTARGSRIGWVGADCSERTCPLAVAWDTIATAQQRVFPVTFTAAGTGSSKITVVARNLAASMDSIYLLKIVDPTTDLTYKYKLSTDDEYSSPIVAGTTSDSAKELGSGTGIFVYFPSGLGVTGDLYTINAAAKFGIDYVDGEDNTAHQMEECAGRGACDRKTGMCTCDAGYGGEACQRTVCPNDCSGHGVCQDLKHFASDASQTYASAWDATKHMGCLCDNGYRGPDCSLRECPSGADPLLADGGAEGRDCSGRGNCDYTTGNCVCHKGFYGERCQVQTVQSFV